jgi:hypothetical protein
MGLSQAFGRAIPRARFESAGTGAKTGEIGDAMKETTPMTQIFVRFFIGGVVVSAFAVIGDVLRPKSFAGLFGAAPSVALATLGFGAGWAPAPKH